MAKDNLLITLESVMGGDSKILDNPNDIQNKRFTKCNSRFKINGMNYTPYKLTYSHFNSLYKSIKFTDLCIDDCIDFNNINLLKLGRVNNQYLLFRPDSMIDLMYSNDITALGILAIVARCYYDDYEFKEYVETNYLSTNYVFHKVYNTWILNEENRILYGITLEMIMHLLDLNINLGIKFENNEIPYTFKWRDED